jgi:DNA-binding MarR family transcriptional regulator
MIFTCLILATSTIKQGYVMIDYSREMSLVLSLTSLQNYLQKKIGNPLSLHGISFTEYLVMMHLSKAPHNSMRRIDLAGGVGLSASGITRVIAPMEKMGLVAKEANLRDARVSLVKITEVGQKIFADATETFRLDAKDALSVLSAKDITAMTKLSQSLLA